MRRIILCIVLMLAIMIVPGVCLAEEGPVTQDPTPYLLQLGAIPEHSVQRAVTVPPKLRVIILEQLTTRSTSFCDITSLHVKTDDFRTLFFDLVNLHPELFYVYSYTYYSRNGCITSFKPVYEYELSEIPGMLRDYEAALDRAVAYAAAGTTPLTRLILANDYFCLNYQYDHSLKNSNAYDILVRKSGTCNAYQLAYAAVLDRLGIRNGRVLSNPMNHTWNIVELDGKWYHIDVCWNDPDSGITGRACHGYFLCSDAQMTDNPGFSSHYGWYVIDGDRAASSTRYDDAPWREVRVPIAIHGDTMYLFASGTDADVSVVRWRDGTSPVELLRYPVRWSITEPGREGWGYSSNFGFLGYTDGHLLFNTCSDVYACSLATGEVTHLLSAPDGYGFWDGYYHGSSFTYGLGQDYGKVTSWHTAALSPHTPKRAVLPAQTAFIDDSAFEGSVFESVDCGASLTSIGSRAFADCDALTSVAVPDTLSAIAPDAFAGNDSLVFLLCPAGSAAYDYARAHNLGVSVR